MASYSKQMFDIARKWLAENPTPHAPLRIPRGTMAGDDLARAAVRHDAVTAELEKSTIRNRAITRRAAQLGPEIESVVRARLTDSERANLELAEASAKLRDATSNVEALRGELETELRTPLATGHSKIDLHVTNDSMALEYFLARWLIAWARHGSNTFELSADFTAAMLLTDPSALDLSSVRMPFEGLLMIIPDGFAKAGDGRSYTKIHVHEQHDTERVVMGAGGNCDVGENSSHQAANRHELVAMRAIAEPNLVVHAIDGAHCLITVVRRDGLTWRALDPDEVEPGSTDNNNGLDHAEDATIVRTIHRIVFGALAYASAVHNAVELAEPGDRKKRAAKKDGPERRVIGRTIRLEPALVRLARAGARDIAFRLKSRHVVRGHYRNQAHGPRWSEHTSRWIAPFWRGPENGAALVHTYQLDQTDRTDSS